MNKDDLLHLLDLPGREAASDGVGDLAAPLANTSDNPAHSLTALEVDDWGLRRGQELLAESERLHRLALDAHAVADFHTAAFVPEPLLQPMCRDGQRHEFLQQMLDTPEYRQLHASTMLDDTAAAIAATAFAEQFATLRKEPGPGDALDREMGALRAVGRALLAARTEVNECKEAAAALGLGPGAPGSNDPHAIAALYRRVRGSPSLRLICELAGRYRRVAQSKQRQKSAHGLDDVVGVTLDGDPGKLLPSELVKLAVPELEWEMLRRLAERQCLAREYRGIEPIGRGPLIICVDESGSMEGDAVHMAKALALALAWIARQQRRWCALVAYSGDTGERLLPLPPGRWDEHQLMDWLDGFIGGGSHCDVPVRELPRYYVELLAPRGRTDVLFVTDAQCRLESSVQAAFHEWKAKAAARLITLVINNDPGDLAHISDESHRLASLDATEAAVGRVLSI